MRPTARHHTPKCCNAAYCVQRTVAVLSALGHHELVVPETELVPEIRKTGKAGSDQPVLLWPRTASNASVWDKDAEAGWQRVKFETCYCSIFDECWVENSHTFRPTAVASCG